jgi:hypothetical protein
MLYYIKLNEIWRKGQMEYDISWHVTFKIPITKQYEISTTNFITPLAIIFVTMKIKQYNIKQRMSFTYDANCCSQPDLRNASLTNGCDICNKK